MLNYINGNVLDTKDKIIFHGCNAIGVMGAGVALAIRNKYPKCYKKYRQQYVDYGLALGDVVWYHDRDVSIANCITQENVGTDKMQVDYNAIRTCVRNVLKTAEKRGLSTISTVKIGCGLAGGSW